MGDSSYQQRFQDAPKTTIFGRLWQNKFDDKDSSLVKDYTESFPTLYDGKVR